MKILPNGVAVTGGSHHAIWCAEEGLVHDKWMAEILDRLCVERNINVAVNVGAHIGSLARVLLNHGCEVHAFEPNEDAVKCLEHNCPEANIYRVAVSEFAGQLPFTRCENAGASYVSPNCKEGVVGSLVCSRPLDAYDLNPDFILADCEGFEPKVLRGAAKTIARCKPAMILEVNQGALERAGETEGSLMYEIVKLGYDPKILQPDCKFGDPQFDVLLLP